MSFGERVREARQARGMSQSDLAARIGVSVPSVSQWENNATSIDGGNLLKLARALNQTPEYLMTGKHPQNRAELLPDEQEIFTIWRETLREDEKAHILGLLRAIDESRRVPPPPKRREP